MSCGEREKAAKSEHTPEPWYREFEGGNWRVMAADENGGYTLADMCCDDQEANARRIVACVNACAGLSNEFLSVATRDDYAMRLVLEADEMRRQRDELLAALRPLITQRMGAEQIREGIQRAIDSVKGETS